MATLLTDVVSYWQGNSTLNAIPFWTGAAKEGQTTPYAVITIVNAPPTYVTRGTTNGYIEALDFQVSVFDSAPDNALTKCNAIIAQFQYQAISSGCISVERINGPVGPFQDGSNPNLMYQVWCEFIYRSNV